VNEKNLIELTRPFFEQKLGILSFFVNLFSIKQVNHPVLSLEDMEALKTTEYRGWRTAVIDATFEVVVSKMMASKE